MKSQKKKQGRIKLIIGPMFAGKTTELMRRVRCEQLAKRSCYVIKHSIDDRFSSESVVSHDGMIIRTNAAAKALSDVRDAWRTHDVIAIDKGQFFDDIVEFCDEAADAGKKVIVTATNGDFRREPFPCISRLIGHVDSIKHLKAVCTVCNVLPASFIHRVVYSKEVILIGGADKYISVCRGCSNAKEKEKAERESAECAPAVLSQEQMSTEMLTAAGGDSPAIAAASKKRTRFDINEEKTMI